MTAAEREELSDLRKEMRESFVQVLSKLDNLDRRVVVLEQEEAVETALLVQRRQADNENRAKLAVVVAAAGVVGGFAASIIGELISHGRI